METERERGEIERGRGGPRATETETETEGGTERESGVGREGEAGTGRGIQSEHGYTVRPPLASATMQVVAVTSAAIPHWPARSRLPLARHTPSALAPPAAAPSLLAAAYQRSYSPAQPAAEHYSRRYEGGQHRGVGGYTSTAAAGMAGSNQYTGHRTIIKRDREVAAER